MLGRFTSLVLAESFSNRTAISSAIILGDDDKFWVVTLGQMERLLRAGFQVAR